MSVSRASLLAPAGLLFFVISTRGQLLHPSGPPLSFEVATIKPAILDGRVVYPPGSQQMLFTVGTVEQLLTMAYRVKSKQEIAGGPNWIDRERYSVEAKIPDGTFAAMESMTNASRQQKASLMMQSLLADRFKLRVHFETRQMPIYQLIVAKGGAKLPIPNDEKQVGAAWVATPKGVKYRNIALDEMLQSSMFGLGNRPIRNATGLDGRYNLTLKWINPNTSPAGEPVADGVETSVFAALEDLGLKLVATNGQVEVVVIDSVEKPTEN